MYVYYEPTNLLNLEDRYNKTSKTSIKNYYNLNSE